MKPGVTPLTVNEQLLSGAKLALFGLKSKRVHTSRCRVNVDGFFFF